jgi:hypothetical protein
MYVNLYFRITMICGIYVLRRYNIQKSEYLDDARFEPVLELCGPVRARLGLQRAQGKKKALRSKPERPKLRRVGDPRVRRSA